MKQTLRLFAGLITLFFAINCEANSFWQPRGPYLQFGAGGTTFQQQSAHSNVNAIISSGGSTFISPDVIYSKIQQNNSLDLLIDAAIGFHINPFLRLALAYSYFQYPDLSTRNYGLYNSSTSYLSANTQLYTVNLYVDFASIFGTTKLNPYIGVGIGNATNKVDTQNTYVDGDTTPSLHSIAAASSQNNFAYKLMVGLNYLVMQHLSLSLQYAFVNAGQYITGNHGYSLTGTPLFAPPGSSPFVYTNVGKFPIYANQFSGGLIYDFG